MGPDGIALRSAGLLVVLLADGCVLLVTAVEADRTLNSNQTLGSWVAEVVLTFIREERLNDVFSRKVRTTYLLQKA